ncbi:hypothetical protein W97_00433 [Coniosporium apollinis CBS 100218]|uniref:Uncharacterized protein n=1 Tax=Coniosporium apollinis (strain CBS 100218) TaxID=1168221 RepID=R7YH35_CONA1|nr:uncharacterized protein W97_00433 [Coniosporium apollinis CBS 100218]EON61220.1 hypothetical protein W97_00433 [Coniosporium apollinis CBS 100218]
MLSAIHWNAPHYPPPRHSHSASHNHHGGRSRRGPRLPSAHNSQAQPKPVRSPKEVVETVPVTAFRRDFEAARSFDIEDDEMFCPFHLLTEDDLQSIHSSGSDRSSLSSGSPESSPLQHQVQPTAEFLYRPMNTLPVSAYQQTSSHAKIHQPLAQRTRNAIPIVDPSTGIVASPPPSVSPARQMQQYLNRRY